MAFLNYSVIFLCYKLYNGANGYNTARCAQLRTDETFLLKYAEHYKPI
jgi:hypothetical protein